MKEEDKDLVYKQATTTKEAVTGTTTNNKEEPVDWIDDAGLSLELADEQCESVAGSTGEQKTNGLSWELAVNDNEQGNSPATDR